MDKPVKSLDSIREKTYKKVFIKSIKKDIPLPDETPLFELELIKKGKLTKNKRFFKFYNDKCIFFKVHHFFFYLIFFPE